MIKINKKSLGVIFSISILSTLSGSINASAASTPDLSFASTYGILSSTYTNTSVTTINGDVGFTTPPATAPLGTHTNYGSGAPYATAGTNQGSALSALNLENCTFNFAAGPINLSTDTTHGTAGTYSPGVYCSTGAMDVAGPLTLSGNGTYIFRPVGALTSTAGATITLTGANACNIFWTPTQATTLAANTTFFGTIIDNAGITIGANTTLSGRALAFGGTVTTDTNTITAPTCTTPVVAPVITPSMGGIYSMPWVTPSIHITKIATPSSLPFGPGTVTYNYVVTNPGTIPMSKITMRDDKCSNIIFASGDSNSDSKLDITESWNYSCTTTLSQTTTNIVTVTGESINGLTATDRATATVIVGVSVITVPNNSTTTTVFPSFPNTGLPPTTNNYPLVIISLILLTSLSTIKISKLHYLKK